MKLKCLFFLCKESYEGQSEPELLFAVDEFKDSRCPELFIDAHEEYSEWLDGKGVLRVIEIEVDQDSIRRLLNEQPKIDGTICDG